MLAERTGAAERDIAAAKERALAEIRGVAADVATSIEQSLDRRPSAESDIAAAVDQRHRGARHLMGLLHEAEFWFTIAVLIFVAILWRPAKRFLIGGLDARAERIRQELAAASDLRQEAERTLAQLRTREREVAAEAEQIIAHAKAEAERIAAESARAMEEAVQRRQRLAEETDRTGAGERDRRNPRGHGRCCDLRGAPGYRRRTRRTAWRGADRRRDRRTPKPAARLNPPN